MGLVGRLILPFALLSLAAVPAASRHSALPLAHAAHAPATASLSLSPAAGPVGTVVTLTMPPGTYAPNAQAVVNFQDSSKVYPGVLIARAATQPDGSLSLQVTLPAEAAAGTALVFVTVNAATISAPFTVQPAIAVSSTTVPAGGAVKVTGSGFGSVGAASFQINGNDAGVLTNDAVTIDEFGSFSGFVSIPSHTPPGPATLTATDGTYSVSIQITIGSALSAVSSTPATGSTTPVTATVTATPAATPPPALGATTAYFAEGFTGQASTNGKANFRESLDIFNPNSIDATVAITYFVQGAAAPVEIGRIIHAGSVLREAVNDDVGPDKQVAAEISSPQRVFVTRTIARTSTTGARLDSSAAQPAAAPAQRWDFPEGYTGSSFQEYLTVLNPSAKRATVKVTLAPQASQAGVAQSLTLMVQAQSRNTANIRALNLKNTAKSVGLIITSDQPIVPERVLYFGDGAGSGKFGSTVSSGAPAPAANLTIGYASSGGFANGAAVGDQAFITLLNPAASGSASVTARFTDATGYSVGTPVSVHVSAGTRQTIPVNSALGASPVGPLSVSLSANSPIEAESAQYFGGSPNQGAHPGVALPAQSAPAGSAFLPDLSTTLADSTPVTRTVYLYNPGTAPISIAAFYYSASGAATRTTYTVPAAGITQVNVNHDAALPAGPLAGAFTVTGGAGRFIAYAIGRTADGLSATEDIGIAGS